MSNLTRQEALEQVQELLSQEDDSTIEYILDRIYDRIGIDDIATITDSLPLIDITNKESLIQEAIRLVNTPEKPKYLVERFNEIYTALIDIAEQELPEDSSELDAEAIVDSWLSQ
jgi:hypothetical protein